MAIYLAAVLVVEIAMMLAIIVTKNGQIMWSARSCFLSECHPLIVMATTQRRYGGAVMARVTVREKPRPLTTGAISTVRGR